MARPSARWRLGAVLALLALLVLWWLSRDPGDDTAGTPGARPASAEATAAGADPRGGAGLAPGDLAPGGAPALPEELTLEGRVVWPDGRAVDGATVRVLERPVGARAVAMGERETESGPDGGFAFDEQPAGAFLVQASLEDSASASVRVVLGPASAPVVLVLLPAASLTVTVVAAGDERPIPGALIKLSLSNDQVLAGDGYREARADARGQARFRGIDPVGNHAVWVEAAGFGGQQVVVLPMSQVGTRWEVRVALVAGGSISGRILDARGQPVAGARVGWGEGATFEEHNFQVFQPFSDNGRLSVRVSDAEGRYRVDVEPGVGCVIAEKPGLRLGFACGIAVTPGRARQGVDLVLLDGARVAGRVVDDAGAGVAGATVVATVPDHIAEPSTRPSYRFRTQSGADGRFSFVGLPPFALAFAAFDDDAASELVDVDLRAGAPAGGITLRLEHTGVIEGRVVLPGGAPLPFAAINVWLQPDYPALEVDGKPPEVVRDFALPTNNTGTVADAEGRFRVGGLKTGRYTVRASRPVATGVPASYGSAYRHQVATGERVELTMAGLGGMRGRVVYDDGKPATAFRLALAPGGGGQPDHLFVGSRELTSADGSFVLEELPAMRYDLRVDGDDAQPARAQVVVAAGPPTDAGTIVVARGAKARRGRVVGDAGEPIDRATVTIVVAGGATLKVHSEPDGYFRIPSVPVGATLRLRADLISAGASDWVELGPAQATVTLTMSAAQLGNVRGVVLGAGPETTVVILGHPGEGAPGTDAFQSRGLGQLEAGGRFVVESVPPGRYQLWAPLGARDYAKHPEELEVQRGRDVSVVFDLATAPRVQP